MLLAMKENVIRTKSFQFAVNTVNLYKEIQQKNHEFVLSKQFVRCGTSIGANVREGINAESKPDFIHKLGIAQKECDESIYWLELLQATAYIPQEEMLKMKSEAEELLRILRSIILTAKHNLSS
jgi:four helix bundle protein